MKQLYFGLNFVLFCTMIFIKLLTCKTNFRNVSVAGWVTSCGAKYKRGALVARNVYHAAFLPKFGKIETVFLVQRFIYFEVSLYNTVQLNEILRSHEVTESLYIVELKSSFSDEKNISGEIRDTL